MANTKILRSGMLAGVAVLAMGAVPAWAQTLQTITVDSSNATTGTMGLSTPYLSSLELSHPYDLQSGSYIFNYAAVYFNPTDTEVYTFDLAYSPVDTVMIIYSGIFDPTQPWLNAVVGNDDTNPVNHISYSQGITLNCGSVNYCPQVSSSLTADTPITLVVSTFASEATFGLPLTFYSSGSGTFAANPESVGGPSSGESSPGVVNSTLSSNLPSGGYLDGGALEMDSDLNEAVSVSDNGGTINTSPGSHVLSGGLENHTGSSGSSNLSIVGGNTLTISGPNTYTGGLTVTEGTTLSVAGTSSLGSGGLTLNNGTLATTEALTTEASVTLANTGNVINTGNNPTTLGGGLAGSGSATITGGNTVLLAGNSSSFVGNLTVTGSTTLLAGSPTLPGAMSACGHITVDNNATLGGNGSVCSVTVNSTGVFSPGNSPGTLTVVGDLTLNSGSLFRTEIDGSTYTSVGGAGSYDRTIVTGDFTGSGTIEVALRGISGSATNTFSPELGDVFTVITADSVNGAFEDVIQPTDGLSENTRFDVRYSPTSVELVVTPANFARLALSENWVGNARNLAAAIDAERPSAAYLSGPLAPIYSGLYGLDANGLRRSVQQLSGEIHAQAMQSALETSQAGLRTVGEAAETGFGVDGGSLARRGRIWGQYIHYSADYNGGARVGDYRNTSNGAAMGVELFKNDKAAFGVAGSYVSSRLNTDISASARIKSSAGYIYGHYRPSEGAQLTGVVGVSSSDVSTQRSISTVDDVVSTTSNKHNLAVMFSVNGNYRVIQNGGFSLWGAGGIEYNHTKAGSLTEDASSRLYALALDRDTTQFAEVKSGAVAQYEVGPATISLSGSMLNQLGSELQVKRTAHLGSMNWEIESVRMPRTGFTYGASVRSGLGSRVTAHVGYERTDRGKTYKSDRAVAGLSMIF